ncbi:MAG: FAD-dependent oxidoreductase [Eggerthellaceae bacterium]|nr:FAD-dependent oxidoreductase [Eggerthellaceae bacterium]MCH4221185.1 FAD-dependent oxidoreductase [Eggerthellaceae bacterium]
MSDCQDAIQAECIVVGDGIAGVSAALAAARHGTDTILVRKCTTYDDIDHAIDVAIDECANPNARMCVSGIIEEIILDCSYAQSQGRVVDGAAIVQEKLHEQKKLRVLSACTLVSVELKDDTVVSAELSCTLSQRHTKVSAPLFADCTDTGDLIRCCAIRSETADENAAGADVYGESVSGVVVNERCLVGEYVLTMRDIRQNTLFDDAIACSLQPPDDRTGAYAGTSPTHGGANGIFTIPYRCLYARSINNIFVGVRTLSCDSDLSKAMCDRAATNAAIGQAIGTAASLALSFTCTPRDLLGYTDVLQQMLLEDDCYIPTIRNHDPRDHARKGTVYASSSLDAAPAHSIINGVSRAVGNCCNYWCADMRKDATPTVSIEFDSIKALNKIVIMFDASGASSDGTDDSNAPAVSDASVTSNVPATLVKSYKLLFYRGDCLVAHKTIENPGHRLQVIRSAQALACDRIDICVEETFGSHFATIYEVRAYGLL